MRPFTKQAGMVALSVALLTVALVIAWKHFSQDPRSKALLRNHNVMLSYQDAVLVITGFTNRHGWTLQTWMSASGATFQKEAGWGTIYSGPYPPPHGHGILTASELASAYSVARGLPLRSDSPPGDRLVLVGFKDGGQWRTRSYDSSALPPQVRQLREMLEGSLTNRATNTIKPEHLLSPITAASVDAPMSVCLPWLRLGRRATEQRRSAWSRIYE